jgi:hypothetical protein
MRRSDPTEQEDGLVQVADWSLLHLMNVVRAGPAVRTPAAPAPNTLAELAKTTQHAQNSRTPRTQNTRALGGRSLAMKKSPRSDCYFND